MNKELELKLRTDFLNAYKTAQREYKFKSPIFIRMLNEHGAYETAKILTNTLDWQKGYEKLAFLGRTDLTVEHIILNDEYSYIFQKDNYLMQKKKLDLQRRLKDTSTKNGGGIK